MFLSGQPLSFETIIGEAPFGGTLAGAFRRGEQTVLTRVGWKADERAVLKLPGPPQVCAVRGYCVSFALFIRGRILFLFFFLIISFYFIVFDLIALFQWLIV